MTDFYAAEPRRKQPSLRVSASERIDAAARTVVLAHRADASPRVLEEAVKAAQREKAALRVVAYGHDMTAGPVGASIQAVKELSRPVIEAGLEFEIQRADQDVASQVLDLAQRHRAALIVLAVRRRSAVMKLFLGSSAQRIIMEAACPVLSVH